MSELHALIKPSAISVVDCASYLRPLRIISFNFCRRASVSGSAKPVSSVLTPLVLLLVPLMALSNWAWLISPGGPREPSLRLEAARIDYMLTGSVALNSYAQPRMTRDIDLVVAFYLKDVGRITDVLGPEYYVSKEAAREAVLHQSSFNAIHERTLIKVDFMVRKREDYRLHELTRRVRPKVAGFDLWVVSKEDLILSKLHWAKASSLRANWRMWTT